MFNFLKKKNNRENNPEPSETPIKEENVSETAEEKAVDTAEVLKENGFSDEDIDLYKAIFLLSEPMSREKFQSLYALYIGGRFMDDDTEPESTDSLSRDELCTVHNALNGFIDNCVKLADSEDLKEELAPIFEYKKELRKKILESMRSMTLYVLNSDLNRLPLFNAEAMYLFTNKDFAQKQAENSNISHISLSEITPDKFDSVFTEYCEAGFTKAIIDMNCCVKISELFEFDANEGTSSPEICRTMIVLNQIHDNILNNTKKENRELNQDEMQQISRLSQGIIEALLKTKLILPGGKPDENGGVKVSIPLANFPDGSKWLAMFTDKSALKRYITNEDVTPVSLPNLLLDQYKNFRNDDSISGILINPGREQFRVPKGILEFYENAALSDLEKLQKKCNQLQNKNENAEELQQAMKQLGEQLLQSDALYAAFDSDFNENYPFMGLDGRAELFTTEQRANNAKNHFAQAHQGNFIIRKIDKDKFSDFFNELCGMGINAFRLDNGYMPVDVWLNSFYKYPECGVIDSRNHNMKNMFIRHLQYVQRLQKLDKSQKGQPIERELTEAALTLQANAYRELGNGVVYVFVPHPYEAGTTLYTPDALAKAEKAIEENKLSKDLLISDIDKKYDVYKGNLAMRVISLSNNSKQNFVCAFTDMEAAEAARKDFAKHNCNDSIVAVTFDELKSQAEQCSGIVMDIPTYGLQIMKKDYKKILEYRKAPNRIAVSLEDNKK